MISVMGGKRGVERGTQGIYGDIEDILLDI